MTITIAILMLKLQSNSFPSGTIALVWSY